MIAHFWQFVLFAQAGGGPAAPAAPAGGQGAPEFNPIPLIGWLVVTGVLFYFIMILPQKKKDQAARDKVNSMKENDRVVTIGGIYGVVTNVQRDQQRVTVRVDEATGTKIRFNMSAIARVVTAEDEAGTDGNKS